MKEGIILREDDIEPKITNNPAGVIKTHSEMTEMRDKLHKVICAEFISLFVNAPLQKVGDAVASMRPGKWYYDLDTNSVMVRRPRFNILNAVFVFMIGLFISVAGVAEVASSWHSPALFSLIGLSIIVAVCWGFRSGGDRRIKVVNVLYCGPEVALVQLHLRESRFIDGGPKWDDARFWNSYNTVLLFERLEHLFGDEQKNEESEE